VDYGCTYSQLEIKLYSCMSTIIYSTYVLPNHSISSVTATDIIDNFIYITRRQELVIYLPPPPPLLRRSS